MHSPAPPTIREVLRIDLRRVSASEPILGSDGAPIFDTLPGCVVAHIALSIRDDFSGETTAAQTESFLIRLPLSAAALPLPELERQALRSLADRLRSVADQLPALADAVPDNPPTA